MSPTAVRIRVVAALVGLVIAAAGLPAWVGTEAASADSATGDGSDWSSSGIVHSSSAVTVKWNPGDSEHGPDVVKRNGSQAIPHTDSKTYDDVSSSVVSAYYDAFSDLKMRVSQTQDLVNQAVTLDISGVKGGAPYGIASPVSLQVFQCWGGLTPGGNPDPGADDPDPATCQMGTGDATARAGGFALANSRYINTDPLVSGGDWDKYFNKGGKDDVPFTAISGKKSGSTNGADNEFFNSATTNEVSRLQVSATGTATRQFEVQTALESPGMGCGLRRGITTTRTCWLVVVPRVDGVLDQNGPIAPSLWAQRMQVKLGFRDIVAGCPSGQDRTLTVGSELLSVAAASWTPGLCTARNIALGYTQLGDPVARTEYSNGASDAVLTSQPVDSKATAYAPVALSAPVLAYSLSYQPSCPAVEGGYTEDEAKNKCGYDSLADLNADIARSGTLVRNLKLNPRLVAKLLTQSYAFAIFDQNGFRRSGWMVQRPSSLANDPEFLRLNPDLKHISVTSSSISNLNRVLLEALRSDAASQIWTWILADHDAKAFIDGCPDSDGMVINPFYSTRTYDECQNQSSTLSKQADADRAATPTPESYADIPPTYPPDGSPYPLPGWQEAQTDGNPPYSVYDFLPRTDSMPVAGRDVAIGYLPRNDSLCLTALDNSCQPAPGKWTDSKIRQSGDRLGGMAITTAATAARFQLPTAQLCNSAGTQCVGANAQSLQKAAGRFTGDSGVLQPGPVDYASGAYPLTMPVYIGVSKSLTSDELKAYASSIEYVTSTGQKPGYAPGDLPPGYAPLTKPLLAQARTAIAELRKGSPALSGDPTPSTSTDAPGGDTVPGSTTDLPAAGESPAGSQPAPVQISGSPVASPQFVTLAAGSEHWPKWPLPLGLAIALIAGLAGPALRFRNTFQIG